MTAAAPATHHDSNKNPNQKARTTPMTALSPAPTAALSSTPAPRVTYRGVLHSE